MIPSVELIPFPPGDTVVSLIHIDHILVSVEEAGTKPGLLNRVICCEVEVIEEQINTAKHLVAVNRTRCILKDVENDERSFCWFFGEFSDSIVRLGVMKKDMVMISSPTVVKTKLKPKQVLPPNLSSWTIHCVERDPELRVIFLRQEEHHPSQELLGGRGFAPGKKVF